MKKQFSLFLAVMFLAVQISSFAHMAKHGFSHHEHNGNPCQVEAYFNASQNFDNAHAQLVFAHEVVAVHIAYSFVDDVQRGFGVFANNLARAPPQIS
jgi:hypothetical protein